VVITGTITSQFQHDTSEVQGKENKINLKKSISFKRRNKDILSPSPTPRCFIEAHISTAIRATVSSFLLLR